MEDGRVWRARNDSPQPTGALPAGRPAADDVLATGAIAPPRGSVARSNPVLQASVWCGLVFALVSLFGVLNALPPVAVAYQTKTQVILSATRLKQLEKHLATPESKPEAANDGVLARVKVLDRKLIRETSVGESQAGTHESLLVEIHSAWASTPTTEKVLQWIEQLSSLPGNSVEETELAKKLRHQRWQLAVAEHYAARHQHVAAVNASNGASDGRTFQLAIATSAAGVPANTASHVSAESVSDQLIGEVDAERQRLATLERAWSQHVASLSGEFRAAGKHRISAVPTRMPSHLAASVLVVGLAMGAIAGWFQYRMQSGGVYEPQRVAEQLVRDGVPHVGTVRITASEEVALGGLAKVDRALRALPRTFGRGFTRGCEVALAAWCLLIVCRFLTDPLWRDILSSSPLAAFGRLIAGLP